METDESEKEAFKRLVKSRAPHVVPILVYPQEASGPSEWLTGGTGMLVQSN